ncbi:MAG: hypothetical protein MUP11_07315 [Anaerolineales bacterium]|nr:hypothetical protein [Anaerolineales bacterium]
MEGPRIQIQEELLLAKQSRLEGNEGRARVCARRAAGAAVQVYLDKKGLSQKSDNALESLVRIAEVEELPDRIKNAVNWLIKRVDADYNLPLEVDLIHEAGIVIQYVEGDG